MSEQSRLDALSEEIVRLRQNQAYLEARIRDLEARAGLPAALIHPPPMPVAPATPPPEAAPPPLPAFVPAVAPPPLPMPAAARPGIETEVGLNWLNRIAVITLMLGAAFLFKYGVDNNWIGPGVRIAIGVIAALISLAAGGRLWHKGQRVFAQGMTGLGFGLLYLSFWASASLYELIAPAFAFVLMIATTAAAGRLALRYESQAMAALGMLGGFLTPVLLSTGEDRPWILFSYIFFLNLGALALGRARKWRLMEPFALAGTVVLYAFWALEHLGSENRTPAIIFALLFYAQFAVTRTPGIWYAAQMLAPFTLAAIWELPLRILPFELLLAAGGLFAARWRRWAAASAYTMIFFWLPVWAWLQNATPSTRGLLFAYLTIGFLLFFVRFIWITVLHGRPLASSDFLLILANAPAYFAMSYWLLNPVRHDYMGLFAAGLGAMHLALAKALWPPPGAAKQSNPPAMLAAGIALAFVTAAVPIQFSGFTVTMAWALEGAGLAWIAARFRNVWFFGSSALVLTLSAIHLAAFETFLYSSAEAYSLLANSRFLTFAVTAVSLWLAARLTLAEWARPAAVFYVAGHVTLLFAMALELNAWTDRTFPGDNANEFTVGLSILAAIYAMILVILGVATRTAIHRILGLVLIGLAVAKLYVNDVWQLGRVFRITAFLALGGLLLAISYLYSKFRPALRKLLGGPNVVEPPPSPN
jgi:uncharacterized membrane protein